MKMLSEREEILKEMVDRVGDGISRETVVQKVEQFMQKVPIAYAVGLESTSASVYGARGIPHAFLIGRDGKVLWHGHPVAASFLFLFLRHVHFLFYVCACGYWASRSTQ